MTASGLFAVWVGLHCGLALYTLSFTECTSEDWETFLERAYFQSMAIFAVWLFSVLAQLKNNG